MRDWPAIIAETARMVDAWWRAQPFYVVSEDADRRVDIATDFLRRARAAYDNRGIGYPVEHTDAVVGAYVNGARAQVDGPALTWADPLKQTARDVAEPLSDAAKTAGTWGAFGVGSALVLLGALYILTRRL